MVGRCGGGGGSPEKGGGGLCALHPTVDFLSCCLCVFDASVTSGLLGHSFSPPPPPPHTPFLSSSAHDRLVGRMVKVSVSRAPDTGFDSRLLRGDFPGRVIQVILNLTLQGLPCQTPGVLMSALGFEGPESVYCDWVR